MTQTVPLAAVPSQLITVVLNGQSCQISVRQRSTGLYLSLTAEGVQIVTNKLCIDGVPLVPDYSPFVGNLQFVDTQGFSDPEYTGLLDRYLLAYTP